MSKKSTHTISLFLALTMVVLLLPVSAHAEVLGNGTCGENLTWVLDESGTLTISGTGPMDDYSESISWKDESPLSSPWTNLFPYIVTIQITPGVTSIGHDAFIKCSEVTKIVLPNSLISIGGQAFMGCSKLPEITIPENVSCIGNNLFWLCSSLKKVVFLGNQPEFGKDLAGMDSGHITAYYPDNNSTWTTISAPESFSGMTISTWLPISEMPDSAPTEPTPTEPNPTEPAPTEPAPTEPAPTEPAPTEPAPTEPAPTEPAPTEPAPTEPAPTEPAPTEPAPTEPAPTEPAPTEPAPTEPAPTEPAPTEPAPTEPAPTEPAPTEPAPTEPAPTEPAPTEPAPTEPAPTEPAPTEPAPTEPAPTEPAPTEPVLASISGSWITEFTMSAADLGVDAPDARLQCTLTFQEDLTVSAQWKALDLTAFRIFYHDLFVNAYYACGYGAGITDIAEIEQFCQDSTGMSVSDYIDSFMDGFDMNALFTPAPASGTYRYNDGHTAIFTDLPIMGNPSDSSVANAFTLEGNTLKLEADSYGQPDYTFVCTKK